MATGTKVGYLDYAWWIIRFGDGACRRKLVGNLPWGIPTVVVYRQTGAQATNLMVTQDTDKVFIQVRPPCGRNTYVLRLIVLLCVELNCLRGVPCLSLYSWLQLPYIMRYQFLF